MNRWCLCRYCVDSIRSRGERLFTRPVEYEDLTDEEYETDIIFCDLCEEDFDTSEILICD